MFKKSSGSRLTLGLSLLFLGILLFSGRLSAVGTVSESFETEPVKIESFSNSDIDEGKIPKRIIIPKLSIDLEVKKARIINGYWEVFPDFAGWGEGSGIPGEAGNQVIFAHAKEGLFLPLKKVELGMKIYILTEGFLDLESLPEQLSDILLREVGQRSLRRSNWFEYEVVELKKVYPDQIEVIAPTQDETLTLYTCSGFADRKRLIVVAKRI